MSNKSAQGFYILNTYIIPAKSHIIHKIRGISMNHGRENLVSIKSAFLTIFLVLSLLLPAVLAEEGEWSQYRNDNTRSGVSNLTSNIVAPKVKWSFETQDRVKSPPTVADINGDGEFEVVFGSNDGHLYVLDRFGTELWNYPINGPIINQPTIGDVDADGEMEVVFGGFFHYTGDPYLYVLNGNSGTLLWDFESGNPIDIHKGFQASPLLYDITGDGALDVLIGSMDYYFYAFDGPTGSIIWKSNIFGHFVRASSPLVDIDKNGEMDIVVVDNHAEVRLYDAKSGTLKWSQDIGHGVEATPVLADVDGDDFQEIILFTIGEGSISGDAVVLNHDGSELWRSSTHTYFYTSPTVIDIDGDGLLDIIGGDSNDHEIVAYKGINGAILWETQLPDSVWSQAPLDLADIDSDGEIEVIAGASPNLYCLNAISGAIEWKFTTSDHIWGQPAIADLEKDGLAEILFGCYDNFLYVLENALVEPVAVAESDQVILEGETAYFNGSLSYDPNYDWHKLDVNYASDSALHMRTIDPIGPGAGAWEGGVTEWVTFSSNLPFWIAKSHGHLGQGPTGKEYTYFWKMHETGTFTMQFRSANGLYYADVLDETQGTDVVLNLLVDHGMTTYSALLDKDHVYRLYIHDTVATNPDFPNDLDVLFEILETEILLTPDLASLVYFESTSPLNLKIEGQGVTDLTFFSRGEQKFYSYYAYQLDHSEDEVTGGEISLAPPPYNTGITPGEYDDSLLLIDDELIFSWDFNNFADADSDGDPTNDDESNDPITSHTYGDNGNFTVTLTITSQATGMQAKDTCFVVVLNVAPDLNVGEPKMEIEIGLRVAGSKWSNVGLTLYEENVKVGYLEVERWPGSPENNPIYSGPTLPTSLDLSKSYKAIVTYDPYPDSMDEIRGDQPNNGKDSKDNAANPVWLSVKFADGSEEKLHHIFNTQQSKIKNSPHKNHIEPWEVNISSLFFGHSFELTVHETDPGSDDLTFTYLYNSQGSTFINLNDPPDPDPFPSPEVNPMDIITTHEIQYSGPGIMTLTVTDDDGGSAVTTLYIP
jgi:outer membrane protein assembly factor BamB